MAMLHPAQRAHLGKTVEAARDEAEKAALSALKRLAVDQEEAFPSLSHDDKALRRLLRAEMRRLGSLGALMSECAYEHWHRMLFARFLAENGLLMHPDGVPVSLADCADLAAEEGDADAWACAARYASRMLPAIFRTDDPILQVRFAPIGRQALERLLNDLPAPIFVADDSLGWVYQFWQTKRKQEVNANGEKVGGADISPVTQLFTEHYMVEFLLHNSLGAWWAARHPDDPLNATLTYLRLNEDGTPAAGNFSGWPSRAADLKVLDPCCGSGHFDVAAFELLRRMRMREEGLSEADAADAVLRDNLFGLELDPRCTQIAAFALAMAAWKAGGYRTLPPINIACSGLAVGDRLHEWTSLAGNDRDLEATLRRLFKLFRDAPDLGSLIDPAQVIAEDGLYALDLADVGPVLARVLADEQSEEALVYGVAAQGVARAAQLLTQKYHLVVTNVPYLARGKQDKTLRDFIELRHNDAKADLATAFVDRCLSFCAAGGSTALVTPQNWLFLGSYKKLRERLLTGKTWDTLARLGPGAFETITGEVVNVALMTLTNARRPKEPLLASPSERGGTGEDASALPTPALPLSEGGVGGGSLWEDNSMEDKIRLFNRAEDKAKRQTLRREAPPAERLLWQHLRGQQLAGLRFRRQYGVGPYVLDFYCPARRLAVEIDGDSHGSEEAQQYDAARTAFLQECGIQVVRFTNAEVYRDAPAVAERIAASGRARQEEEPLLASPSERGGTGQEEEPLLASPSERGGTGDDASALPTPALPLSEGGVGGGSLLRRGFFLGLDASAPRVPAEKAALLRHGPVHAVSQAAQLNNPDARLSLEEGAGGALLSYYADSYWGLGSGDYPRYGRCFWELPTIHADWIPQLSTVDDTIYYGGREHILYWQDGKGDLVNDPSSFVRATQIWGKQGIHVSQMRHLPVTLYTGEAFDTNSSPIIPKDPAHLPAIWAFCSSPDFHKAVRRIDQALKVTNASLVKVPFDLAHWQKVADVQYPDGLPAPHSDDPTQWLFGGHPVGSTAPLQVAVARLLGYRWPQNADDDLADHADADGIVCLPTVAGETPAGERLRALLAHAYGGPPPGLPLRKGEGYEGEENAARIPAPPILTPPLAEGGGREGVPDWSPAVQEKLLADAGGAGKDLDEWLRDSFFAQHCKVFGQRPFIWHVWDGRKDGFAALVNSHTLDRAKLDKLIYTYLGGWINTQKEAVRQGVAGSDGRLVAAEKLQVKLKAIADGEAAEDGKSGYDIYVRWKPLAGQPIGWDPDINDGVRMNIRPFLAADVLRARPNINWNKDRGKNPDGSDRLNDRHLTRAEKEAARRGA